MLAFILTISAFGQSTMELTFTAENSSLYVPLDSILIVNVTQGVDTMLYAPDTVLVLDYVSGIDDKTTKDGNRFSVSQNYPNPFYEKTKIDLFLSNGERIKISIRDILGREVAYYEKDLNAGHHSFEFYPSSEKCYFLTATGNQMHKTIKMMNAAAITSHGERCRLVYAGYEKMSGFKSNKATNRFGFTLGDELKFTSYTGVEVAEITDAPTGSQTYVFQFDGWTPCPGIPTITDIDGNIYNTVQIGNQCWMKSNLKTTTYQNGTVIPNVTDINTWKNLTTGAYVWYNNDTSWKDPYGALYNAYTTVDTNGLCPSGWHVPTDDEWTALTDFIGGIAEPHGNELKSCRQVNSPLGGDCNTTEHPRWEERDTFYGTDDYGFSGLPGGHRHDHGNFYKLGTYSFWWSSTEYSSTNMLYRALFYANGLVSVQGSPIKQNGFSVRCLKD